MGYTYTKLAGPTMRGLVEYVTRRLEGTVHYTSIRGQVAYMAVSPAADPTETVGVVVLATHSKGEWGYKLIDEDQLPYYYGAPKRLLRLLTPTRHPNALEWRARCTSKRGTL